MPENTSFVLLPLAQFSTSKENHDSCSEQQDVFKATNSLSSEVMTGWMFGSSYAQSSTQLRPSRNSSCIFSDGRATPGQESQESDQIFTGVPYIDVENDEDTQNNSDEPEQEAEVNSAPIEDESPKLQVTASTADLSEGKVQQEQHETGLPPLPSSLGININNLSKVVMIKFPNSETDKNRIHKSLNETKNSIAKNVSSVGTTYNLGRAYQEVLPNIADQAPELKPTLTKASDDLTSLPDEIGVELSNLKIESGDDSTDKQFSQLPPSLSDDDSVVNQYQSEISYDDAPLMLEKKPLAPPVVLCPINAVKNHITPYGGMAQHYIKNDTNENHSSIKTNQAKCASAERAREKKVTFAL